ncbi:MAG: hypothetical protein WCA04_16655 [Geobacteraceae bacterium]
MRTFNNISNGLFEGVLIDDSEKRLLELTQLSDDELYRRMGIAGRETLSTFRPGNEYMNSPNIGDSTGKSPFFFRSDKIETSVPAVYFHDLPADDLEAGKTLSGQISAVFDRLICESTSNSPLYGYKQEAVRLGNRCVSMISGRFPNIDKRIVMAYVAMRTKDLFNVCTLW